MDEEQVGVIVVNVLLVILLVFIVYSCAYGQEIGDPISTWDNRTFLPLIQG